MIDKSQVSIIIPHLGGTVETQYALDKCLKSLDETVPDIKKIVAYNNFDGWDGNVPEGSIFLQEQGQCKAVNAAVATTNTPWIFITNNDMIYAPGWFEKLVEGIQPRYMVGVDLGVDEVNFEPGGVVRVNDVSAVKQLDDIVCISPMLVEPRQGAPTFLVQPFGGAGGDFNKQGWLDFAKDYEGIGIRTGFNMPLLIKRDLWDTIGGYDINYDPWGSNSDSDLEYKIKLAGVQPYQNTNCIVYHFSQTSGTFEPKNDEFRNRNYAYFKDKWGFDRTDDGIWEADFIMPNKERIFRPDWENKFEAYDSPNRVL